MKLKKHATDVLILIGTLDFGCFFCHSRLNRANSSSGSLEDLSKGRSTLVWVDRSGAAGRFCYVFCLEKRLSQKYQTVVNSTLHSRHPFIDPNRFSYDK